jgi:hypothetical protein
MKKSEPISFIEMKSFLIDKFREFSIDEFYFGKHPYFIYHESDEPKIDVNKVLKVLHEKYDIIYFHLNDAMMQQLFSESKISYHFQECRVDAIKIPDIKKELNKLNNYYYLREQLISKINNEIFNSEFLKKDDYYFREVSTDVENFKNWALDNFEIIRNYEAYKLKELKSFDHTLKKLTNEIDTIATGIEEQNKNLAKLDQKFTEIKNLIDKLPAIESENLKRIEEIEDEINKLTVLKEKEPYKSQIVNLLNEKEAIPIKFNENNKKLNDSLIELSKNKDEIEIQKINLINEKTEIENRILENESSKEAFVNRIIQFNIENELSALNSLTRFLFHITLEIKEYDKKYSYYKVEGNLNSLFFEIYDKYELSGGIEWKKGLNNIFKQEINSALIFAVYQSFDFFKPKFAQIRHELKHKSGNSLCRRNYENKIETAEIDVFFPVFCSLKNALKNTFVLKNHNNVFYLNLNNGIYAKIIAWQNKIMSDDLTLALTYTKDGFQKNCEIFSGYTKSGFILNQGVYLNYKEWSFEISFEADALLIQNFNSFQQIQSIPDGAKSDYEEEQRRYDDDDD